MFVWSNGAHQNCFFLAKLFESAGHKVVLINGGDGEHPPVASLPKELRNIPFVRAAEVLDELDVLIECGAQVSAEDVARVRRSIRGGRSGYAITYKFGNALAIDAERAIHNKPAGAIFNGAAFDEVWTTTQHEPTCGAFWETCYRAPLRVLPHIWESYFVDEINDALPVGGKSGYVPGRERKRVAILEPNINWVKTAHVPMLVAELAYRKRPDLFEHVMVTNAEHLRERLPFSTFANALDICRSKAPDGAPMCSFEGRWSTPVFMAKHADVVVSHGWIDTPTYLHYDLIHLGYPLVHNISELRDAGVGYHYPYFDSRVGGSELVRAMSEHDASLDEYEARSRAYLETRKATSPVNVKAHTDALAQVMA